jgi:broad specificity phosphatase PhoE
VHCSKLAGVLLKSKFYTPDIVVSSNLVRAIETAHLMFPDHKVRTMPFLNEIGSVPFDLKDQRLILDKHYINTTDWLIQNHNNRSDIPSKLNFEIYLKNYLNLHPQFKSKSPLKVAVVSHGNWIKKYLNVKIHPLNNTVFTDFGCIIQKGYKRPSSLRMGISHYLGNSRLQKH